MLFEKESALFKAYLEREGYSKPTEQSYSYETGRFIAYLEKYYPSIKKVEQVNSEMI